MGGRKRKDLSGIKTSYFEVLSEFKKEKNRTIWKVKCLICHKEGFLRQDLIKSNKCSCNQIKPKKNKTTGLLSGSYVHYLAQSAKHRGIIWELNSEYLWALYQKQNGKCYYTNQKMEIAYSQDNRKVGTLSLDRLDSTKGYIPGNVVFCVPIVNLMKRSISELDFYVLCEKIIEVKNSRG